MFPATPHCILIRSKTTTAPTIKGFQVECRLLAKIRSAQRVTDSVGPTNPAILLVDSVVIVFWFVLGCVVSHVQV